jgi:hypothetical protein
MFRKPIEKGATGILPVLKWLLAWHFSLAKCQWHPGVGVGME